MNSKKTILIVAGGLGTRYKGLKQVDGILSNGSPILEYSIYDALKVGFNKIVIIINRFIPESYIERLENISKTQNFELHWVYQDMDQYIPEGYDYSSREKPWGTGHAVLCAKQYINEPFVMINADDFYGKEIYQLASKEIDSQNVSDSQFELIAYPLNTTLSDNGTVARGICTVDDENFLIKVEEQTSIRKENNTIVYTENGKDIEVDPDTLVSMNYFIFHPSMFESLENYFNDFIKAGPQLKEEFYIPSALQRMNEEKKVKILVKTSPSQWLGMTYPDDKIILKNHLEKETQNQRYPEDLWKSTILS
ncbi:nucleotidyltransferase [Chryseobacterium piperi]|uniref:Nucleotidyltransferase n=1 Tax=Chryseobacterium piperi TaxID=558152 RepID=A0A086B2G4_9FLAO|nr:sugar phosphate nucleotidyltransferase [Chryseobacterium piperi]ASW73055.1 nucleotidyltransferase [Chryseobacterium piperi]KFF23128.1 nucleotidyltransferase [Chryseobacterium piperi]